MYVWRVCSRRMERQDFSHNHRMITTHRTDDRLDGVEVDVVHDAAVARQSVSTSHVSSESPLDAQRCGVVHVHEAVAASTAHHRQVGTPRAAQQISARSLLRFTARRLAYRVSAHQLHTTTLALEEGVDVPHAQPGVQRVAQPSHHRSVPRIQVAAVGRQADSRD